MWCEQCQAEVAAQATQDQQRLQCATCGLELPVSRAGSASSASSGASLRDPRELLARWAQDDLSDPLEPLPSRLSDPSGTSREMHPPTAATLAPPVTPSPTPSPTPSQAVSPAASPAALSSLTPAATVAVQGAATGSPSTMEQPMPAATRVEQQWRRFDAAGPAPACQPEAVQYLSSTGFAERPLPLPATAPRSAAPTAFPSGYSSVGHSSLEHSSVGHSPLGHSPVGHTPTGNPGQWVWHEEHSSQPPLPHFTPAPTPVSSNTAAGNWATLAGQMLAYLGVGTLTIGATLVLMGYFGDSPGYAPTGWLVTTMGQMLLFLGVVTLVSGGMDQTTQEVARRIDQLGDKIVRLEQAALPHRPQPPHFSQAALHNPLAPAAPVGVMLPPGTPMPYAPRSPE